MKEIDAGVGEEGCEEGGRCSLLRAAVAETRGGGGEGGERRQRATGVRDNRVGVRTTGKRGRRMRSHAKEGPVEGDGDFQAMAAAENGCWIKNPTGCGRRCWAWTQGRRMRRGRQETGKEGAGGSASASPRRKQRRRKRPRSMAATASSEAGTGGLMKTETRPTATEKSEGREDPHVVGDGKEEEGERDSGGDEVCRGSGNSITEEKGGGV